MMTELEDYRDYPKALALLQSIDICLYLVTAVVIYLYAGNGVTSPALSSAGPLIAKIAYGVALPTVCSILVSNIITQLANVKDYNCRCYLRPHCIQNNLCPNVRRDRSHAQEGLRRSRILGWTSAVTLGCGLDHCLCYSCI